MLISNQVQRQLKMSIALTDEETNDSVCFREWGDEGCPLIHASSGNPASSLLDFDPEREHPGVSEFKEQ